MMNKILAIAFSATIFAGCDSSSDSPKKQSNGGNQATSSQRNGSGATASKKTAEDKSKSGTQTDSADSKSYAYNNKNSGSGSESDSIGQKTKTADNKVSSSNTGGSDNKTSTDSAGPDSATLPDKDLLKGMWKLDSISCSDGSMNSFAGLFNDALTSGDAIVNADVRSSGDSSSNIKIELNISEFGINCNLSQNFKITYKSSTSAEIATTSSNINNCPSMISGFISMVGSGISSTVEYEKSGSSGSLTGQLPIKFPEEPCPSGKTVFNFTFQN
ncbi:MAG: hypothetical protein HQK54_03860 [Oligoflexales bacterium]|nr:hypothetical protein [Oligoflexales bacterium]